ncbi:hypothetical protein JTB14_028805 [Gonioctena quinquepunctata]|nr:hypothetical protein JTB14_028805 [Gonioctena quinquepunctata]
MFNNYLLSQSKRAHLPVEVVEHSRWRRRPPLPLERTSELLARRRVDVVSTNLVSDSSQFKVELEMASAMQMLVIFILSILQADAVKPPGYVEPKKVQDQNPPRYEYGYNIANEKGGEQGKQEQRDGIYAAGRYYVQGKGATQDVRYFADDWGYHPAVEYSSVGPNSKSSAKFALGHEAVQQLKNKEVCKINFSFSIKYFRKLIRIHIFRST